MPLLPTPNLDDRRFQEILDEARRRIPLYCPEWTDHNLSDPGITLLELFSWMADMLVYRLNRVPDKNYVKFLEMVGVHLQPAKPATTDLTFRLSAPQPEDVVISLGTEVATLRTENRDAVTFATDRDMPIRRPQMAHLLASREGSRYHDFQAALNNPRQGLGVFSETPQEGDALYMGFGNDLSGHTLAITLSCRVEGIGVNPSDPPLAWETWVGGDDEWARLRMDQDTTGGLNKDGVVILHLPITAVPLIVDGKVGMWVRCRALRPRPGQAGYGTSPRVTGLKVESIGGSVPASHTFRIGSESLGASEGAPGQVFQLRTTPVLPRREDETLEIARDDGTFEPWIEVHDFGGSGPDDKHFVLDDVSGTIELGPRIRAPHGQEEQYGSVPVPGRAVRFSAYRSGGGIEGNVGARTLSILKSSIPYVASVTNFGPAIGGTDSEDIEHAKWRAPHEMRVRERAVTPDDFEELAVRASPAIGRARCSLVTNTHDRGAGLGVVQVLLVPALPPFEGAVPPEHLQIPPRIRRDVMQYLDDRRLLTSEVVLGEPPYTFVNVSARVWIRPEFDRARVSTEAASALYAYLHPTLGGPEGNGWPFGRELYSGELFSCLQHVAGVDVVEQVVMHVYDPATDTQGPPLTQITPPAGGLLCSHEHAVDAIFPPQRWK